MLCLDLLIEAYEMTGVLIIWLVMVSSVKHFAWMMK